MTVRRAAPGEAARLAEMARAETKLPLLTAPPLTPAALAWLAEHSDLWVWDERGALAGFAAADPRDGHIRALTVAPGQDGRGVGRTLLEAACRSLRDAGHAVAILQVTAGSRAEGFYRAAGWREAVRDGASVELHLPLQPDAESEGNNPR